jgi:hypothetical protein
MNTNGNTIKSNVILIDLSNSCKAYSKENIKDNDLRRFVENNKYNQESIIGSFIL